MKLDPKNLKLAAVADVASLSDFENRGQFRDAISASLAQRRFFTAPIVVLLAATIDFIGTLAAAFACALRYPGYTATLPWLTYLGFATFGGVVIIATGRVLGTYNFTNLLSPFRKLPRLVFTWVGTFMVLTSSIFLLKIGDELSRIWLASWTSSGFCFFLSWRFIYGAFLRRLNQDGHFNKTAVLVGGGENAAKVITVVENSQDSGINLIGVFDDRDDGRVPPETRGLYKLGSTSDLIDFVRSTPVDILIVTLPTHAEARIVQLLNRLWVLPVDIRLSAQGQTLRLTRKSYSYIGNLPCLDVYDRPLGEWGPLVKSIMDKVLATLALVMFSPIMLAVALAIKWDSKGPVLFKQKRYGFNNEMIEIFKFRSMYLEQSDSLATQLVTKGDARVTRVGRFIRRTTLDELPQLFNVLRGELSLVGPRPHATMAKAGTSLYEHVVDGYFARHRVKPGLTGWAQINGWRGETDTAEKIERRVEFDLYYIENWSLTFDLYILARTPLALLNTKNAY